ncbi:MAG: S41 family peptidase [Chloroflexota bacterium]
MTAGYYRFPTINNDTIVFVSEDDLWHVPAAGGVARRLTSNFGSVSYPSLSPDGQWLAFVGREEGTSEVYVMPAAGGSAQRLTFLSGGCCVLGWTPDSQSILFSSAHRETTAREHSLYQISPNVKNGEVQMLPYGPARTIAMGNNHEVVLGRNTGDLSRWKRYRGGTAGHLWIDQTGDGGFVRLMPQDDDGNPINGNIASPIWMADTTVDTVADTNGEGAHRVFFASDHEGIGNLYSCAPDGTDLRRHTDHEDFYVRNPSRDSAPDGQRIIYHAGADLFVYDSTTDETTKVAIEYHSPQIQRNRKFAYGSRYVRDVDLHPSGLAMAVTARGKPFAFHNHEGPTVQYGKRDGVRYRLATWLNDGHRILMVSDEPGEEVLEIHTSDLDEPIQRLEGLDIGRPISIKISPAENKAAITNHRHELIIVDLDKLPEKEEMSEGDCAESPDAESPDAESPDAESPDTENPEAVNNDEGRVENAADESVQEDSVQEESVEETPQYQMTIVDRSPYSRISGFNWSPDGRWLAYGFSGTSQTTAIKLYRLADPDAEDESLHEASTHTVTKPVLHDVMPSFDPEGKYLYFLSYREFNPVYDAMHFDIGFPWGMRPYLLTLRKDVLNPFVPRPDFEEGNGNGNGQGNGEGASAEEEEEAGDAGEEEMVEEVDTDEDLLDESLDDALDETGEEEDLGEDELDEGEESSPAPVHASVMASDTDEAGESAGEAKDDAKEEATNGASVGEAKEADTEQEPEKPAPRNPMPYLKIDLEGMAERILAFPVSDDRYGQIEGVPGKALFTSFPVRGRLGVDDDDEDEDEEANDGLLRAYIFKEYRTEAQISGIGGFQISKSMKKLAYRSGSSVRVVAAGEKAPVIPGGPSRKTGWLNLNRIKVSVDPQQEWLQMFSEAWRLQRDQFWTADMSQIDWQAIHERYRPLVKRVSTRNEFSDLVWEMQGELGTSHAYEYGGDHRPNPRYYGQGFLGATITWDEDAGGYRVQEILRGDAWDRDAHSPLAVAGIDVRVDDVILAVNGQRLTEELSPAQLLVNQAGEEVLLTIAPRSEDYEKMRALEGLTAEDAENAEKNEGGEAAEGDVAIVVSESETDLTAESAESAEEDGESTGVVEETTPAEGEEVADGEATDDEAEDSEAEDSEAEDDQAVELTKKPPKRGAIVKTAYSEIAIRYRAWVNGNRERVHEATDGRIGYVHIPDMGANGYAEFHRGYLAEVDRDGLIVDVRYNAGGHVSQLILEKLARRRIGYDVSRWGGIDPYPNDSVAGPIVALTNEHAGSDGDIFCHSFKLMKLGPLIGKRTWGGVIGISPRHALVDGTITTQPEFSFWFEDVGWHIENYGTEPDIEVDIAPQDFAAGRDPQLDKAVEEALRLLAETPILKPDMNSRPSLALPKLPPRKK